MDGFWGIGEKSTNIYKLEAQKIAFAPFVFQVTRVAKESGILEIIYSYKEIGCSLNTIIEKSNLSKYAVKVILDAIKSIGLVTIVDNNYVLTKTGYFILKDKMTEINMNFTNDVCYNGLFYLDEALKNGKPAGLKVFGNWKTIYEALSELPEQVRKSWFDFDHYYSDAVFDKILPIIFKYNPNKIIDIGGNTGKWAIKCANYNKNVNVTIIDLPGQINDAKKIVSDSGLSDRITFLEANILDDKNLSVKGDIIWMSQFLDCFSEEEIVKIVKKAKNSLNSNGKIFILETFVDNQRYETAEFCLNMTSLYFTTMANGNSRMYRINDMKELLSISGFKIIEEIPSGISHTLLIYEENV